jgi:sugar phosphate isomerase/epimerase
MDGLSSSHITRRSFVAATAGCLLARAQTPSAAKPLVFGFSLYGMKTLPWREGLSHVARIGYKSTELCLRSGWDTEPKQLTKTNRAEVRQRIGDLGLWLAAAMENMALARQGANPADNLERLRAAAEVCHECSPGKPAILETTVGGRDETWEDRKNAMAEELASWAKRAEELDLTLAIKAHSKTAMNRPERLLWLFGQVKSPRLRLVYDYSHFEAFGLDMRKTMEQIVPHAVFVHIKDTVGSAPTHHFVLPGDGQVDFRAYMRNLIALDYRGAVVVEVSVDVFDQPGYDPVKAAEHVWQRVSPAFA